MRRRTTNPLQRFMRGGQGERLVVEIRGHELEIAAALAKRIEILMKAVPGIADVRLGREEGLEERTISIATSTRCRPRAPTRADIARHARDVRARPRRDATPSESGDEYDIRVDAPRGKIAHKTSQLGELSDLVAAGVIPLSAVAQDRRAVAAPARSSAKVRSACCRSSVGSVQRPLGAVVTDLEAAIAAIELPARIQHCRFSRRGHKNKRRRLRVLQIGIVLAILLVFAVMAVQFESLRHPLILMSAVPFGFVGVVGALWSRRARRSA